MSRWVRFLLTDSLENASYCRCVEQVPSEDPSLNAAYAMQYVRGLQEDPDHPGVLKVVATGKHFFAYDCENCRALGDPCMPDSTNSCTTDRTKFNANVSNRDLVEYYWPAWRAAAGGDGTPPPLLPLLRTFKNEKK